jgi:hypothetical protein
MAFQRSLSRFAHQAVKLLSNALSKFDDSLDGAFLFWMMRNVRSEALLDFVFLSQVRTARGFGVGSAFDCTIPSSSLAIHPKLESCLAQS